MTNLKDKTGVWAKVNGEDVEKALDSEANDYYNHWRSFGIDPATGEKIKKPVKQWGTDAA